MFDNTQSNFNPSNKNLDDLNQGKNYPFKSVNAEKKLSGLKGPIEDILAGSETDLSVGHLPTEQNNIDGLGLKEIPTVPSMTARNVRDNYNQGNNNMVVGVPPLPSQKKGKFFIILIVLLIVVIFGLAGFFAYNYLIKNKTAPQTLTPNESLQELMKSLNEEKQNENVNQENKDSEPVTPTAPVDSDSDGLSDERELELGTNPGLSDTDNDGLSDLEEIDVYQTNPALKDTDADGYEDGLEVKNGYDPAKPGDAKLVK